MQPYGCPAHPNLSANSKNKNYFLITVKPMDCGVFSFCLSSKFHSCYRVKRLHGTTSCSRTVFSIFPFPAPLLALYIVYPAVLFFQSTSANKRRGSTSRSTRTVNPQLGFLGLFGFAGFLGFWTYRVDQTIFPFVFFLFFGFFGFFYEGKMSNTLIDERYKESKMRAQSTVNKTALSIIFLQY